MSATCAVCKSVGGQGLPTSPNDEAAEWYCDHCGGYFPAVSDKDICPCGAPVDAQAGIARMPDGHRWTTADKDIMSQVNEIIDMDHIVTILRSVGYFAYVEQTGGGCATLYAGPAATDGLIGEETYAAVAGPGWFEQPVWRVPVASRDEFYVGPDDHGEDLDASTTVTTENDVEIAQLIIRCITRSVREAAEKVDSPERTFVRATWAGLSLKRELMFARAITDVGTESLSAIEYRVADLEAGD